MNVQLPDDVMCLPLKQVRGPVIGGIDVRFSSWDIVLADVLRSQDPLKTAPVVRPIFVGKVYDERHVFWALRQYQTRFAVVDCRPEATLAIRLQEQCQKVGIELWRSAYNTNPTLIEVSENKDEMLYTLERTITLERVYHMFETGIGALLPINYKQLNSGSFVREMTSSKLVYTNWHNTFARRWEKTGPDHPFHSWNLLLLALRQSGLGAGAGQASIVVRGIVEETLQQNMLDGKNSVQPKPEDPGTAQENIWTMNGHNEDEMLPQGLY